MIDPQKSAALQVITEHLANEKPVILHDAYDSGEYVLFLKSLTELTRNRDLSAEENQAPMADYLASIKPLLPFLFDHGLITHDFDFHTITIGKQEITGLTAPEGEDAQKVLGTVYEKYALTNPFAYADAQLNQNTVKLVLQMQGLIAFEQKGAA